MTTDLDAADLAVLERLRETEDSTAAGDARTATEAGPQAETGEPDKTDGTAKTDKTNETDENRLSDLEANGLVAETDDGYELTESGRRLLRTEADDSASRPDVPADVERAIEAADCPPDVADALARAVAFLRNWDTATAAEIIDAAYSETAAEYDDGEEWWDELVRERLAALPGVVPPLSEGGEWRYDGSEASPDGVDGTTSANPERSDGRRVLDGDDGRYGSAKHALEREATDDAERAAFAAAFEALADADADSATTAELAELAGAETGSSVDADRLAEALASVPGARREGDRWRYDGDERYWSEEESAGN